jgi:hypothetical protein
LFSSRAGWRWDGESSGDGNTASLAVQDDWLKQTITPIMASPAWQTQRSLPIVTWDEDESQADDQVAAVVARSQGSVRAGYGDSTRYDHYSTGRTIENALGLAPITANDRYATPLNGAFGTPSATTLSTSTPSVSSGSPLTFHYCHPGGRFGCHQLDRHLSGRGHAGCGELNELAVRPGSQRHSHFQYLGIRCWLVRRLVLLPQRLCRVGRPDSFTVTN